MCNESDAYEDGEKDELEGAGSGRDLSARNVDALKDSTIEFVYVLGMASKNHSPRPRRKP